MALELMALSASGVPMRTLVVPLALHEEIMKLGSLGEFPQLAGLGGYYEDVAYSPLEVEALVEELVRARMRGGAADALRLLPT